MRKFSNQFPINTVNKSVAELGKSQAQWSNDVKRVRKYEKFEFIAFLGEF